MLHDLKIKLTSPILGAIASGTKADTIYRLRRGIKDGILIDVELWCWAIEEAAKSLSLSTVHPECVRILNEYRAPTLGLYTKRYKHPILLTESARRYEAISTGAVITMPVEIVPCRANGKMPDEDEMRLALSWIGKWVGITQWGHEFNYGRFTLISFEPANNASISG